MNIAHVVLTALLCLLLIVTGGGKLAGAASSIQIRDSLQVPAGQWRAIGVFEVLVIAVLVIGMWSLPFALVGAAGVVVLMVGAIGVRVRAGGEQLRTGVLADVVVLVIGVAAGVTGALALG